VKKLVLGCVLTFAVSALIVQSFCQSMPLTTGETLSGKRIALAETVRGRTVALVAGFSREGGSSTAAWVKAMHSDHALKDVTVYQVAMLAGAPSLLRGMIKSSMKKGVAAAEQDNFVVLVQDEKLWRDYFDVSVDKDPYVLLIDASGKISWHGHGAAAELEPQLRAARH
jgi:ATP10 protein